LISSKSFQVIFDDLGTSILYINILNFLINQTLFLVRNVLKKDRKQKKFEKPGLKIFLTFRHLDIYKTCF